MCDHLWNTNTMANSGDSKMNIGNHMGNNLGFETSLTQEDINGGVCLCFGIILINIFFKSTGFDAFYR